MITEAASARCEKFDFALYVRSYGAKDPLGGDADIVLNLGSSLANSMPRSGFKWTGSGSQAYCRADIKTFCITVNPHNSETQLQSLNSNLSGSSNAERSSGSSDTPA
ncbi:hypothetical protein MY8738_006450 [Beauveria namnaoensis]